MDIFEQAMRQMAEMPKEERIKMIEVKKELCICADCMHRPRCTSRPDQKRELPGLLMRIHLYRRM